jgi:hypothetical protein
MRKFITGGIVLVMLASPAFAAKQYWIVRQSIDSCAVVDERPKSPVTIAGNKAYASRAEAEHSLTTTRGCFPTESSR